MIVSFSLSCLIVVSLFTYCCGFSLCTLEINIYIYESSVWNGRVVLILMQHVQEPDGRSWNYSRSMDDSLHLFPRHYRTKIPTLNSCLSLNHSLFDHCQGTQLLMYLDHGRQTHRVRSIPFVDRETLVSGNRFSLRRFDVVFNHEEGMPFIFLC